MDDLEHCEGYNDHFIRPDFWQALGRARKWQRPMRDFANNREVTIGKDNYRLHWHRFSDHLADGKDAESFFASLT